MATKKKAAATAKKKTKVCNVQEKLFVVEYMKDLNAYQAGLRAGYADTTAAKKCPIWVSKSRDSCPESKRHVWEAMQVALAERIEEVKVDANWVLSSAKDLYDRCMQVSPVMKNGEMVMVETPQGDVKPAFTFDSSGAGKALDIIGKHVNVQAFNEKSTVHHVDKDGNDMTWTVQVVDSTKATA